MTFASMVYNTSTDEVVYTELYQSRIVAKIDATTELIKRPEIHHCALGVVLNVDTETVVNEIGLPDFTDFQDSPDGEHYLNDEVQKHLFDIAMDYMREECKRMIHEMVKTAEEDESEEKRELAKGALIGLMRIVSDEMENNPDIIGKERS